MNKEKNRKTFDQQIERILFSVDYSDDCIGYLMIQTLFEVVSVFILYSTIHHFFYSVKYLGECPLDDMRKKKIKERVKEKQKTKRKQV